MSSIVDYPFEGSTARFRILFLCLMLAFASELVSACLWQRVWVTEQGWKKLSGAEGGQLSASCFPLNLQRGEAAEAAKFCPSRFQAA